MDADKQKVDVSEAATAPARQSPPKSRMSRVASKLRAAVCLPSHTPDTSTSASSDSTTKLNADKETDSSTGDKKSETDAEEDQTMKSEFKFLDRKIDDDSKPYYQERKKEDIDKGEKKDWWQLFAFCVVRRYDEDGDLEDTCLSVNPQPLRQLLKDVIGDYPSDPHRH